jgi:hypothetical protein
VALRGTRAPRRGRSGAGALSLLSAADPQEGVVSLKRAGARVRSAPLIPTPLKLARARCLTFEASEYIDPYEFCRFDVFLWSGAGEGRKPE